MAETAELDAWAHRDREIDEDQNEISQICCEQPLIDEESEGHDSGCSDNSESTISTHEESIGSPASPSTMLSGQCDRRFSILKLDSFLEYQDSYEQNFVQEEESQQKNGRDSENVCDCITVADLEDLSLVPDLTNTKTEKKSISNETILDFTMSSLSKTGSKMVFGERKVLDQSPFPISEKLAEKIRLQILEDNDSLWKMSHQHLFEFEGLAGDPNEGI